MFNPTPAQLAKLYALLYTPLADADIAGDLTGWCLCKNNTFAKLVIPAAANRARAYMYILGGNRELCAEYADVVAVTDGNGNAIASTSIAQGATPFSPGARITAASMPLGLMFHPTLIEAATCHYSFSAALPNLTALGL